MHDFSPVSGSRRMVLLVMAAGLLCMLGASFIQRLQQPSLVVETPGARGGMPAQDMSAGVSPEVGQLMQQIKDNPNDVKALVHLAEHLVGAQQWEAAETFARRAAVVAPSDPQPSYLLGVILHNKGQHAEAAEALERVVVLQDDASVRYSLGVLYIHYLQNVTKGVEHLSAGLHDTKASETLKKSIREELEKAPLPAKSPAGK